ncbi:MAG: tetratricopeptide repeat protein [Thermoflexales bacterium]|nr:tetratricopeptide repeat protein [Thermoflexales bacterium]
MSDLDAITNSTPVPADDNDATHVYIEADQAERRLALAVWKAEQKQFDAAQNLFEHALELAPARTDFWMAYAAFLAQQEKWEAAKQQVERAAGDAQVAAVWLDKALAGAANDPAMMYLKAVLLAQLGQHDHARLAFEQLLATAPAHGQAWFDHAVVLEALGEIEAANQSYRSALDIDGHNLAWLVAFGSFLERHERDKQALGVFNRALEQAPQDPELQERVRILERRADKSIEARKLAALAKYKIEEQDEAGEAEVLLADALRMDPECALAHRVQATLLIRQGAFSQAEAHAAQAAELEPDNTEYQAFQRSLRADLEPRRQKVEQLVAQAQAAADIHAARALLNEAFTLVADDVQAHLAYARLLLPGQASEAEEHLRTILALSPQQPEANKQYALLLLERGDEAQARSYILAALEQWPGDEEMTSSYAAWLIEQGRHQEALDRLQPAMEASPASTRLQVQYAVVLARMGQIQEALPRFEALLQTEPQNAILHREYAVVLRHEKRYADAEAHLRAALETVPDDAVAHRELATLLATHQRYYQALEHIQQAVALRPGDEAIQAQAEEIEAQLRRLEKVEEEVAFAAWLSRQGTPEHTAKACQAFERALAQAPGSALAAREYALFLEQQGELEQARDLLDRALAIVPGDPQLEARREAITRALEPPATVQALPPKRSPEPPVDRIPSVSPPPKQQSFWDWFRSQIGF